MKKLLIIVLLFGAIDGIAQNSYQERINYSRDTTLRNKVKAATYDASGNVIADTSAASRIIKPFANEVYRNPNGGWLDAMTMAVLTNPVITPESSDQDVQFVVLQEYSKVAKAWVGYVEPAPSTPSESGISNLPEDAGLSFIYDGSDTITERMRLRLTPDGIITLPPSFTQSTQSKLPVTIRD